MTRNLRIFGLALVAVLALSALAASPASAFTKWFTSTAEHTLVSGSQIGTDEFVTGAGTVKCGEANYHGSIESATKKTETVTITPTYSECTVSGVPATITMNGCDYVFHSEVETPGPVTHKPVVDIVCPSEKTIVIHASLFGTNKCTVTIHSQSGLTTHDPATETHPTTQTSGLTFTHEGAGETTDLRVDIHLNRIHYTAHAGTGFGACSNEATGTNATYKGAATMTGKNTAGNHVAISYDE